MCGLTGWISTDSKRFGYEAERSLRKMQSAIRHRGPDGMGAHIDRPTSTRRLGVAMGFVRLAIRDTLHGAQPMIGGRPGQHSVISTVNGEIYSELALEAALEAKGYRRRTKCDAELVAHGAQLWSDTLWPRLDGMFAAAIWNPQAQSLTLSRDETGMKPLYLALIDEGKTAIWGSELGAILAHPGVRPELDPRALRALLWLDYVPAPGTLLRGVYKLPPGVSWTLNADDRGQLAVDVQRWGEATPVGAQAPADPLAELEQRLESAVVKRLVSDVPLCVFLSGGVDSSLVALMASRHVEQLNTVSIRFEETSFDESRYAREVAAALGARHHEILFRADDGLDAMRRWLASPSEPLADPSLLVTTHLCRHASEKFTVAIGGDGGDEAWLGYPTFAAMQLGSWLQKAPMALRKGFSGALNRLSPGDVNMPWVELAQRFARGLTDESLARHLTWIGGQSLSQSMALVDAQVKVTQWDRQLGWVSVTQWLAELSSRLPNDPQALRESALLSHTYLAEGVLQKVDQASMAHGLEVRAPWLDRQVRELACSLEPRQHRQGRRGKLLPRALAARYLPAHVARRAKKGFGVPLAAWLRGPLRTELINDLSAQHIESIPGIDHADVSALVDAHISGRANHHKTLLSLWRVSRWWAAICS